MQKNCKGTLVVAVFEIALRAIHSKAVLNVSKVKQEEEQPIGMHRS